MVVCVMGLWFGGGLGLFSVVVSLVGLGVLWIVAVICFVG